MEEPLIVTSPVRTLSGQDRKDLRLHEACKAAKKSDMPYEFDWLIELLHAPSPVYTVNVRLGAATLTIYESDADELLARLSGARSTVGALQPHRDTYDSRVQR